MTHTAMIRPAWTPATIALMVLGFMVFWPLGLAMLAYILWGDRLDTFKSEVNRSTDDFFRSCKRHAGGNSGYGRTSGNVAFDAWREQEIERLNEERRKLDEMRADFDAHMRDLRMARDREEFDAFLAARDKKMSEKKTSDMPEIDG